MRAARIFQKAVTAGTPSKIMRIEGMHCANCKKSVEKALTAQNGVIRADADVDRGIARVFYENGVDDAKLQEAVEKEGFGLRILRRLSKRKSVIPDEIKYGLCNVWTHIRVTGHVCADSNI